MSRLIRICDWCGRLCDEQARTIESWRTDPPRVIGDLCAECIDTMLRRAPKKERACS
jgi:hypothetical protein